MRGFLFGLSLRRYYPYAFLCIAVLLVVQRLRISSVEAQNPQVSVVVHSYDCDHNDHQNCHPLPYPFQLEWAGHFSCERLTDGTRRSYGLPRGRFRRTVQNGSPIVINWPNPTCQIIDFTIDVGGDHNCCRPVNGQHLAGMVVGQETSVTLHCYGHGRCGDFIRQEYANTGRDY